MTIQLRYHGDFCFELEMPGGRRLVIDPNRSDLRADYILLTHWLPYWPHAVELAKSASVTVLAARPVADHIRREKLPLDLITLDLGHSLEFPWGRLITTYADHHFKLPNTPDPVSAIGTVIEADGHKILHGGPARLHEELKVIGLNLKPDVSLLPCGGNYLSAEELARAVMWLGSDIVLPFQPMDGEPCDPDELYTAIDLYTPAICRMIPPGDTYTLEATESTGRIAGPEARY